MFDSKYRNHKYTIRKKLISKAKARLLESHKETLQRAGYEDVEVEKCLSNHEFTDDEIETELDAMDTPPGFARHQWLKFKIDMKSEKAKELSKKGKEARAAQTHTHTTGTKSYAQVEDEYVIKHKVEPGLVKLFDLTHKRKDGTYIEDASRQFMMTATSELKETSAMESSCTKKELENVVWYKLMGEDSPGRARGYGLGVTKSQVSGFRHQLKKMRLEKTTCDDSSQIQKLQALLSQQNEKIIAQQQMMTTYMSQTDQTITSLRDEVQIYRTSFGSFAEDHIPSTNASGGASDSQDSHNSTRRENRPSSPYPDRIADF